jgi:hypothetical protein
LRNVAHGEVLRWSDVEINAAEDAVKTRRAMEARFAVEPSRDEPKLSVA